MNLEVPPSIRRNMQTIDPIVSPVTNLDQLRVKIPQRNSFTEAGTASPDGHSPTNLPTPPPPLPPPDSTGNIGGNKSNNSSCTEMSHPSPTAFDNTSSQQPQPPHHLLKHHLHPENAQALSHFDTDDVKEASREISRMGQRDLQAKFKLVYGTQTHSNNNEWLRRKLYEAIGALPVKTNTNKSKGRRHHHQGALAHQLPKLQHHLTTASPSTGVNGGGLINDPEHQLQQHGGSSPRGGKRGGGLLRSPASTPRKLIAMELKRRMSLVPSSPRMYASSVLDVHRNISDETDSSGDDDDNGGGEFELDDERQDESTIVGSGDGKDAMAVPRATTTNTTVTTSGGAGHLRSFTRLASQQQQQNNNNNNSSSVVIGTFLAQDAVYYTPPNAPHQALVTGNTGSGAGAAMRRVSRAGLSRLHPTYWQQQHRQQQQQQQPAAKPSSMVAVGWMPRSSSTTQLLKSMDLDVLGDREWPDALRFNPHDSFNLASMPDDEEFYNGDEQQQFQMEGVKDGGNTAAASGVMDYYCN